MSSFANTRSDHLNLDLSDFTPAEDLSRAWTLPARWYLDPRFLELEKEKIFWQTWQPVGRLDMVRRAGDYIQHEDIALCEAVQKRLKSRSYDQGRFSVKRENGVHHFQSLVHEFLTRG